MFTKIGMRDYVLDSTRLAKLGSNRFRGFRSPRPQIRDFAVPFDVTVGFWGFSIRLQPTLLNGFLHKVRQKMSFRVRKCLFGGHDDLIFPKNRYFGDRIPTF